MQVEARCGIASSISMAKQSHGEWRRASAIQFASLFSATVNSISQIFAVTCNTAVDVLDPFSLI